MVYGFCFATAPTVLWTAVAVTGILPRAKKVSTGHFFARPCDGPLSSNPIIDKKNRYPKGTGSFYGVDNGIRTHDLQSHNLTR